MIETMTRDQRATLEYFTKAPIGRAVMDGQGYVWTHSEQDVWYARRHPASPVDSVTLARALAGVG